MNYKTGIFCDNCGKAQTTERYYTFFLNVSGEKTILCKKCLRELTEVCVKKCQDEGIYFLVKR